LVVGGVDLDLAVDANLGDRSAAPGDLHNRSRPPQQIHDPRPIGGRKRVGTDQLIMDHC
jgi:hypothetical protein